MSLAIDEVLKGEFRFRTKQVDYGDGLVFNLHSFDADTYQELMERLSDPEHIPTLDDCTAVVMRAIEGQQFDPTEEQIAAFKAKLDLGTIQAIYHDWIMFNGGAQNLADAAKKS